MSQNCSDCGLAVVNAARFCPRCGVALQPRPVVLGGPPKKVGLSPTASVRALPTSPSIASSPKPRAHHAGRGWVLFLVTLIIISAIANHVRRGKLSEATAPVPVLTLHSTLIDTAPRSSDPAIDDAYLGRFTTDADGWVCLPLRARVRAPKGGRSQLLVYVFDEHSMPVRVANGPEDSPWVFASGIINATDLHSRDVTLLIPLASLVGIPAGTPLNVQAVLVDEGGKTLAASGLLAMKYYTDSAYITRVRVIHQGSSGNPFVIFRVSAVASYLPAPPTIVVHFFNGFDEPVPSTFDDRPTSPLELRRTLPATRITLAQPLPDQDLSIALNQFPYQLAHARAALELYLPGDRLPLGKTIEVDFDLR